MGNRQAVTAAVQALDDAGRLEASDQALVEAALTLADAVDVQPANASLWREYTKVLGMLGELKGAGIDAFDAFLSDLRAQVGDPSH